MQEKIDMDGIKDDMKDDMKDDTKRDEELQCIEDGFSALVSRIERKDKLVGEASGKVRESEVQLLRRMGVTARGIARKIGLNLLKRGKHGLKDDIFDAEYYPDRVLVLGKAEKVTSRPDDPTRPVIDQFCVLSEKGEFMEVMYSSDGMFIDSFRGPLSPAEAVARYGDEILFMLYRALHDYLEGQDELLIHLNATIAFIFGQKEPQKAKNEPPSGPA